MPSQSDSLRIVTLHPFDSAEVAQIKAAAPKVPIDFVVCRTREEFDQKVKDADAVYGDIRGEALKARFGVNGNQ